MNTSSTLSIQDQEYNSNFSAKLSPREMEITSLIVNEYSTKQIAGQLYLSIETIKTHRKNIMQKLQAKSVAGIVREAIMRDIINISEYNISA